MQEHSCRRLLASSSVRWELFDRHYGDFCTGGNSCAKENGHGSTGFASIDSPVSTSHHARFYIPIRKSPSLRQDLTPKPHMVTLHLRICARGAQHWLPLPRPEEAGVRRRAGGGRRKKAPGMIPGLFVLIGRRPTLPRTCARSTIGAERLNYRVRDGNGWDPLARITQSL